MSNFYDDYDGHEDRYAGTYAHNEAGFADADCIKANK